MNYYILFDNYTQAMALQDLLRSKQITSRITPTPHSIQNLVGCGVAILVDEEMIARTRECIDEHEAVYAKIVEMPCQINPKRNKFC